MGGHGLLRLRSDRVEAEEDPRESRIREVGGHKRPISLDVAKDKVAFYSDNNDDGCGTARSPGGVVYCSR